MPVVSSVVTNGNGPGTKNVVLKNEKWVFSSQSSVYSAIL